MEKSVLCTRNDITEERDEQGTYFHGVADLSNTSHDPFCQASRLGRIM
jgi:hypothetical protein